MTIYFGEKPVFLTNELAADKRKILKEEHDTIYMEGISNYNVQSISKEIAKPTFKRGIIFHENLQELKDHFFGQFKIIKESHWFEMKANSSETLIPQTEEDILEIKWADDEELQECLKNTYSTIKDILELDGRI